MVAVARDGRVTDIATSSLVVPDSRKIRGHGYIMMRGARRPVLRTPQLSARFKSRLALASSARHEPAASLRMARWTFTSLSQQMYAPWEMIHERFLKKAVLALLVASGMDIISG